MKNYRLPIICLLLVICSTPVFLHRHARGQEPAPPYKDPALPLEKRVDDLVSRMTLEEKVSQMMNAATPIERLGIPAYDWWNEALHGVARAGYATVFPQAIGLAATWDEDLVRQVADVASTEARAKYNEFERQGDRARYHGLTFWSPNINIFRDPRWGRGQETYGEDPYLTSRLGVAFVKGLQGDNPSYLKVVSTPKHFAVHSGPEPERHGFDANVSERDLETTYLPAFRAVVQEGKAEGIMCAYNRTDGLPCCANQKLYDILRKEWDFKGHVVSDCGAITDIYRFHHFAKTAAEASALAVKAGTDLSCGGEYRSLLQAVRDKLISEAEIDVSVKRLMTTRFRLGMFDPPEKVPFASIPYSENASPAHREVSLKAARESIVLLKNEKETLPLKKDIKTIAVIGPNADAPEVLLGNYNGQPTKSVTPLAGIRAKVSPATKVLYTLGSTLTGEPGSPVPAASTPGGFKGEYFNNKELKGDPVLVRSDEQVNFDWSRGRPAPQVNEDNFSVRWTGKFAPPESGTYQLGATADDGLRLYLDGRLLIDAWDNNNQPSQIRTVMKEVNLEAGHNYDVRIEYYEDVRNAIAKFIWSFPRFSERITEEAVNTAKQADAVVLVMGISPALEGEEMTVNVEGFRGGDRTDLSLPKAQEALIKAVQAVGKPVVLVLLNGSALAVNWEAENVPAIVEAWYPGEEGGTAIADVLFGDYNPGGRLPVTFYKSINQLPPFENYAMDGRTYRYFKGDPLYPFGFGLSYSSFRYENLKLSAKSIKAGDDIKVSIDVVNSGTIAGDEVVELYLSDVASSFPVPIRSLAGVKRVFLEPGKKQTVTFTIKAEQMVIVDDTGRKAVEPGDFAIVVGGKQPGFTGGADAKTTGTVTGKFTVTGKLFEIRSRLKAYPGK
ncbi:MAG: glycoside hydrolase family 3 C-terminal domain-containing protein [Blastocatellia bacterium]|nr:glycoside hydrolase family 3 C-terminal domain-containing protein [Blastocatellia bacterium]